MSGKKMAGIIVAIILVASLAAAVSILVFFKTYEKPSIDAKEKKSVSVVEQLYIA